MQIFQLPSKRPNAEGLYKRQEDGYAHVAPPTAFFYFLCTARDGRQFRCFRGSSAPTNSPIAGECCLAISTLRHNRIEIVALFNTRQITRKLTAGQPGRAIFFLTGSKPPTHAWSCLHSLMTPEQRRPPLPASSAEGRQQERPVIFHSYIRCSMAATAGIPASMVHSAGLILGGDASSIMAPTRRERQVFKVNSSTTAHAQQGRRPVFAANGSVSVFFLIWFFFFPSCTYTR